MQTLKQIYRTNYAGENIVTQLNLSGGDWNPNTEYVPNSITNIHTTTQAVAIGNGTSRLGFNLSLISSHKGGLLGVNKLQSYGCNALYRDFTPDFLIANGEKIVTEISNSGYADNNIVYAHADALLSHPGKFYLIPQNVYIDAGALAAYIACFDGHKKVFLLGYDEYDQPGPTNNVYVNTNGYPTSDEVQNSEFLVKSLINVVQTYNDVEFIRVMPAADWWLHESLQVLPNFRQISFRDFVLEADIG